jgi:putative PIN family toxin of toxin-antitoxin system
MQRVVVDTDIFIRAIYHGDLHAQSILRHINEGRLSLLTSYTITREIRRMINLHPVIAGLDFVDAASALRKVDSLLAKGQKITSPKVFNQCPDPADNMFFDCAIAGQADCIVAIDQHIHSVANPPVQVKTPWQFLQDHPELSRR